MAAHKLLNTNSLVSYSIVGMICVLIVGSSANPYRFTKARSNQFYKHILVHNNTQALQVTKAEINGNLLHLSLKNGYNKNINWFRISFGNNNSVEADFTFAEPPVLAPNASYEDDFPIQPDSNILNITIVSVLFDDNSSDGNANYAQTIKEKRNGQKIQLKRLLPLLQDAINTPDKKTAISALKDLEVKLSSIQDENNNILTEGELIGRRNINERMLNELLRLEQLQRSDSSKDVRQGLSLIKEHYGKIISKLEANN
jgi:hypothetical protein